MLYFIEEYTTMENKSTCKKNKAISFILKHKSLCFFILLFVLLILIIYKKDEIFNLLLVRDVNSITDFVGSFGFLSFLAFIILVIIEVVVAPIPSIVLYAVGGILFGTVLGGTGALIGNIIGAWIAFTIARRYGRQAFEKKINKRRLKQFDRFSRKYGSHTIFFLRINPITSSDIFSYLAGFTKMNIRQFILGTISGLAPLIYIQSYLGGSVIKDNPLLTKIFIILSIAYVAVFFYWIYHMGKKK